MPPSVVENLEVEYSLLSEKQRKAICISALFFRHATDPAVEKPQHVSDQPLDTPVKFVIRTTNISDTTFSMKLRPKSKLREFPGFKGKASLFALLQLREDHPLPWLWGFRFCVRAQENRLVRLNSEIRKEAAAVMPSLDLHIKKVGGADHLRIYELQWNDDVKVCDPVQRAASITKDADKCLRRKDFVAAFRKAVRATIACSLYFPAYKICLECLRQNPGLAKNPTLRRHINILSHTSSELQQWLEYLNDFNLDHIPKEFHEDIRKHCIAQNDARLEALEDLKNRFTDSEKQITPSTRRNPANQVLDDQRLGILVIKGGLPVLRSEEAKADWCLLMEATRNYIVRHSLYEIFEKQHGTFAAEEQISDKWIFLALAQVAGKNKTHYFPEPHAGYTSKGNRVDRTIIEKTAVELAHRVVALQFGSASSRGTVSIHGKEDYIGAPDNLLLS